MILSDIRQYLQRHGEVSLADIALHFDSEPATVRAMLEVWIKKGRVQRRTATASCGTSCSQCDTAATEIYAWSSGKQSISLPLPTGCNEC